MCMQPFGTFTTECGVFTVLTPSYNEPRPFYLGMLGFKDTICSTGCHDGFVASYAMWNGRLFLAELTVLAERHELPDICGIYPESPYPRGDSTYRGLRLPLGYSGDLWVTPDDASTVRWSSRERTQSQYRLCFHGGLLSETEHVAFNRHAHWVATNLPVDQPIGHLSLPENSTPFDAQIVSLSEWERERIDREDALEHERRAKRNNST
jgi:hypothetical protein